MGFIEYHEGCGDFSGCFGPRNDWITILDVNLGFFLFLIFLGLLLSLSAYWILNKYSLLESKKYLNYLICIAIFLLIMVVGRIVFLGYTGNILY